MLSERISSNCKKDAQSGFCIKTKVHTLEKSSQEESMEAGTSMDIGLTPSEEQVLAEKNYEFSKMIGEGACGKVYLCSYKRKPNEHVPMACKIIHTSSAPKEIVAKFLPRELDILQKVNHPNIVHVYCIFQGGHGDKFLIFMKVAEFGDLLDFILREGEIAESVMKVWFFQMAVAVEYLHTLEITHRDLKCENILITERYNAKLADFGFSRFVVEQSGKELLSSTYCGSLPYCAPEILKGKPYHPKATDVWALGVVLFVGLNRSMPFPDLPVRRIVKLQARRTYKFRQFVLNSLSPECLSMVHDLLEPDWKKRPTISEVLKSKWFEINGETIKLSEAESHALEEAKRNKKNILPKKIVKGKKIGLEEDIQIKSLKRASQAEALVDPKLVASTAAVASSNSPLDQLRKLVPSVGKQQEKAVKDEIDPEVKEYSAILRVVNSKTAASSLMDIGAESDPSAMAGLDKGTEGEEPKDNTTDTPTDTNEAT